MTCPLLPPSLRYKPENIYLHSITSSPREPFLEEANHFLTPLVNSLVPAWRSGVWYSRTYNYPRGRLARSALACLVTDLPGARKVTGMAGHMAKLFCSFCWLNKDNIDDLNWKGWKRRAYGSILAPNTSAVTDGRPGELTIVQAGILWRDAPSKKKRKQIFSLYGARYSVLTELEYFVLRNLSTLLGMDLPHDADGEEEELQDLTSSKLTARARKILDAEPTAKRLGNFTKPVLRFLCQERKVESATWGSTKKLKKRTLIDALLLSPTTGKGCDASRMQATDDHMHAMYWDRSTLMIGEELIEECTDTVQGVPNADVDLILTKKDVEAIQMDITRTTRPTIHTQPPPKIGTKAQGKLKADEWRSLMEFDLPVTLVHLWWKSTQHHVPRDGNALGKFPSYIVKARGRIHHEYAPLSRRPPQFISTGQIDAQSSQCPPSPRILLQIWAGAWLVDVSV
ncbi:hypothetical protein A0H81_12045 [Grifola frondosa]|uniref:Uncharacterized protein n=1 Tax=Grifola frondosa TaxID=5627 RepID=A0A1C7LTX1_GRIFR|nr:hypothetical protein A0H81_12045 [Grifola frondosa]